MIGDRVDYYMLMHGIIPAHLAGSTASQKKEEKKAVAEVAKPAAPVAAAAAPTPAPAAAPAASNDDDDMFGEDDDEEEMRKEMEKAKIAAAHAAKKPKKEVIAKSTVVFDVKPFEAETDMAELEACVRAIVVDGLIWGASKLEDVAYGVKKLVINTVVEDDKVSIDDLQDAMCALKDGELVQSTEIVAFNKI